MKCRESSGPEDKLQANDLPRTSPRIEFSIQARVALRRCGVGDLCRLQAANGRPAEIRSL